MRNFYYHLGSVSAIFIALLVLFFPVLFQGKVFANGDTALQFYPAFSFFDKALEQGNFDFQLPEILSGFPIYASQTGGFFSPINWLFLALFDFITAYHWLIFLDFFLAGLFVYLFAMSLKLSRTGGFIAAFSYIFSFWLVDWGELIIMANFYFLLPLLFLALLKISQGKKWYFLLAGVGLGLGWLSANAHFVLFIALVGFFYALFLDWNSWQKQRSFFANLIVLRGLVLAGLLSILIGLPQILPALRLSADSARAQGLSYGQAAVGSLSVVDLISHFLPYFKIPYFGWGGQGLLYTGFLPLFFAVIAFFNRKENRQIYFFVFLYLFGLIASLPYSPLFWLIHQLPFFSGFRVPARWLYFCVFALALLAAYGYEVFLKNPARSKKIISFFGYLVLSLCFLAVLVNVLFYFLKDRLVELANNFFAQNLYSQTTQMPFGYYAQLISRYVEDSFLNFSPLNYRFLIPLAFLVFGWWLAKEYASKIFSQKKFVWLVILTTAANLLLAHQGDFNLLARETYLKTPSTAEFIRERESDLTSARIFTPFAGLAQYRLLTVAHQAGPEDIFAFQSAMITPNLNVLYGLASIDGYDNLMPVETARTLAQLGSDYATAGEKLSEKNIPLEQKLAEFVARLDLLRAQRVKYVISAYQLASFGLELVFEATASRYRIPVYVYQLR